ncbi:MAG TPA: cell division protein FtsH, partial [Candidatus Omnitrophota bacterium]|nr:cell division protein FtsH [Candidatus Omnitrophota bacterium]
KVSIIPRGMAGGYTLTPPTEDKHYLNKKELMGQMTVLLGGLVGEEVVIGDTSTGVSNDLERVSQIARHMVCTYGMSDKMGSLAYGKNEQLGFLGRDFMQQKDYSEETAKKIDEEVRSLVNAAYTRAKKLLTENRDKLDILASTLVEKEVLDIDEARRLLGMAPTETPSSPAQTAGQTEAPENTNDPTSNSNAAKA